MTKLNARVAGVLLAGVLCAGCNALQRQAFREPEISVSNATLAGGIESQRIDIDLAVYNPNNYRLDGRQIRYKAFADSIQLATGTIDQRVTLPPRDTAVIRVPVVFDSRVLPTLALRFLAKGSVTFLLTGDLLIETTFGSVTRSFEQRGTFDGVRINILPRRK